MSAQLVPGSLDCPRVKKLLEQRRHALLIDPLRAGRVELLVSWVFHVAQYKYDGLGLSGLKSQLDMVRTHGRPAVRDGIGRHTAAHDEGCVPTAIGTQKYLTRRVVSRRLKGTGKVGEMVAALPVLGLVIDNAFLHLDLAGGEVALEVGDVIPGIPETELQGREDRQLRRCVPIVGQDKTPNLEIAVKRHKVERFSPDAP